MPTLKITGVRTIGQKATPFGPFTDALALAQASYIPPQPPGSGWTAVDAFDVSAFKWFRVKEEFAL